MNISVQELKELFNFFQKHISNNGVWLPQKKRESIEKATANEKNSSGRWWVITDDYGYVGPFSTEGAATRWSDDAEQGEVIYMKD